MSTPDTEKQPIPGRWLVAVVVVIILALAVMGLSVLSITQYRANNRQDVQLAKAQAAIAFTVKLRASEKRNACSRAIAGSKLGNNLLGQIQERLNAVAEVATNPAVAAVLTKPIPLFPVPKPGCPQPKPKKQPTP